MRTPWASTSLLLVCAAVLAPTVKNPLRPPPSNARFVEARDRAGLHFQFRNSPTPNKYLIETMGGGVALLDYDGDGWLDVFLVNGAALGNPQPDAQLPDKSDPAYWNRLFRNNRDGTFADVTEKAGVKGKGYGMGAAVGDYDNDGFPDLFVTNYGGCILYHNNGDGTFTDVTAQSGIKTEGWTMSAGFLDYDNDGYLDLFVTRYLEWNFARGALICGPNVPGGRAYCHPNEFKAVSNYLFHNNRDGTFTDVSEASRIKASPGYGLGVSFGDFNNDGFMDIYVANDAFPQFLFKNNGNGTFTEQAAIAGVGYTEDGNTFSGMGTDFADLDNDGFPDILTTALPYEYFALFHNNGDGTFGYASVTSNLAEISRPFGGWGIHVFDFDNDGNNEVFVATSHVMDNIEITQPHLHYLERPLLLKFQGGKFEDISSQSGEIFSQLCAARGAAFGDLDNNGRIDVVVSDYKEPAHLLRNEGGNRNHWIELDLEGTKSNRDAIGARVRLTAASGRVQYRTVSTAGSYASANDRRVAFGIGAEDAIREIHIRWPSGIEQTIDNPRPDQILHIKEDGNSPRSPAARNAVGAGRVQVEAREEPAIRRAVTPIRLVEAQSADREYERGVALLRQNKTPEAIEALAEAVALRPDFVDARYALGVAYSTRGGGYLPAAIDQFVEVLRLKPGHVDARVDLSSILAREGDSYAAAQQMEAAIRYAPQNADLYVLLGKAHYDSHRYAEALEDFGKALDLDRLMWAAHYGMGLVLAGQKQRPEAAAHFQKALSLHPTDPFSHYELARIALDQGDYGEAGNQLRAAVDLKPDLAQAHAELGKLYRRLNQSAQAEASYRRALSYRPNYQDALYNLATLLQAEGRSEDAKECFEKVKALQESKDATRKATALNAEGIKYTGEGRPEEALAAFRKALQLDPGFFMAAYNQGVVLGRMGKKQEAMEGFRAAIRLRPDFVMAHYALGMLLKAAGDPSAEGELARARLLNQYVAQPLGRGAVGLSEPP